MVEPATTAATTAPREPRPSFRALRAIGAQPMHFKGLGLGVKAQFTRGLVQQIDHLLFFQFHRVVATVANQEWHRMLRGSWRSDEPTSELQSLICIPSPCFCLT